MGLVGCAELCCGEGLCVEAAGDDDVCVMATEDVESGLGGTLWKEHGAADIEGLCCGGNCECCVSARCYDEMDCGAMFVAGLAGKEGETAVLEGMGRLEILQKSQQTAESAATDNLELEIDRGIEDAGDCRRVEQHD